MCGFVGFVSTKERDSNDVAKEIGQAVNSIAHRGPDAQGLFINGNVALGHARLSVMDLSEAGAQPMSTECGRFTISYNGELYNFKELATQYGIENCVSNSDTEVLLRCFEKIGLDIVPSMNGMFAIALYDRTAAKLWLIRDRLGIKPVFYKLTQDGLIFGSEIKAIESIDKSAAVMNISAVNEWSYYGNSLGEKTLYSGIYKLLPGSILEVDTETLKITKSRYWSLEKIAINASSGSKSDLHQTVKKTRELLESAVKKQLISDVPVGVFLSGGIDSSAITAFASRHYEGRISTYSVGFDFDRGVNELPAARKIAEQYKTDHHEVQISGFDVADVVEKMVHHNDVPFSDAANIPLFLLCDKVKEKTKVVLQGDGGDELFGGYRRYNTLSHINAMRVFARVADWVIKFMPKNSAYYHRQRYINALSTKDPAVLMALLLTVEDRNFPPTSFFSEQFRKPIDGFDPFERYQQCFSQVTEHSLVDQMLLIDKMIILPDIFLEKVDRATMAAGVEVRVPFLDNDLVDFCLSLSSKTKIKGGVQKWLLKKSLEGVVPNDTLYGQKNGFNVPFGYWLKGPLKELLFDNLERCKKRNPTLFDTTFIQRAYAEHCSGSHDYGFLLWKLLNLTIWINAKNISFE